ncbi:hypothetical protein [Proteocatella sphenisci]|uniref:hypothetical protein n=1 Tax=Proteocatella sphenisci TaxID=181070 RepID=UPI00048FF1E7|nr:hypothetical protein [Proteocatella sphenisci]
MNLCHGFSVGYNNITGTKIMKWRGCEVRDFTKFVDYLVGIGFKIIGVGDNYFKVLLLSDKQVNFFYYKVIEYKEV